ncbi:MAG: hypothetical protein AOA66_0815 [Candidatus Bathyarchaeota archaeon BA2]|nr:MAG: hypothetical protein AOA66_0815 [Candidatus Bathyarchaeota archaeon BA2]
MNRKCKKLKQTKRVIKPRKSNIPKRPQFCKHPIPRRKRIKRLRYTAPPIEVDATGEVLLGSATAGPAGTMIGVGSATVRTFSHIGISVLKKIRERAEEIREAEKEST